MHLLLIEYQTAHKNATAHIDEGGTEEHLCNAFDKLNMATLNELLSGMKQLHGEFEVIHEQLVQCKRASLEYAYTMGDLYGIVLGMSGQYQAISDIISKLSAGLVTEALREKVHEGRALLRQVFQAWRGLEDFFTNEVDAFKDVFYETTTDGLAGREEEAAEAEREKPEDAPFSEEQVKWLHEQLAKMGIRLSDQDME